MTNIDDCAKEYFLPHVSITIPVYANFEFAKNCIGSINIYGELIS